MKRERKYSYLYILPCRPYQLGRIINLIKQNAAETEINSTNESINFSHSFSPRLVSMLYATRSYKNT